MVYRTAERWSSRVSVILAVTGSAVGLGNFLRFPTIAAQFGGGEFLIPYLCALLIVGLPFMWVEWAFGRYGGIWGRHSLPGIYDQVTRRPWGKYLGVLGLYLPFIIVVYYLYVESWTLGYTFYSALGQFGGAKTPDGAAQLLHQYLGIGHGGALAAPPLVALIFLGITLLINFYVVFRGVESGIEKANMIAMPLLFVVSAFLMFAIFSMKDIGKALDVLWRVDALWRPDLRQLWNPEIWLAAVGQVLFTLSLAVGAVITYTSYLRKDDDVALGGATPVAVNTFAEIILGASLVFPIALIFFGMHLPDLHQGAAQGPFTLPFLALPSLFAQIHYGQQIGALWFLLLFFAGITSSVSLLQPILAFFQDELGWERRRATLLLLALTIACLVPVVLWQSHGFLNELDFWAVQVLLPIGALIEVLVFLWVLGIARGWEGITVGAFIRVPRLFRFVIQYVLPLFLFVVIGGWLWTSIMPVLVLANVDAGEQRYIIFARVLLGAIFLAMMLVLRFAWLRRLDESDDDTASTEETTHVP